VSGLTVDRVTVVAIVVMTTVILLVIGAVITM